MRMATRIEEKLRDRLNPEHLFVEDESVQHAGHAGAGPGGETHFRVEIIAAALVGLSRVERHRLVHNILSEELEGGVHALSLKMRAPGEA